MTQEERKIFQLKPEQQRAFNALKKAYKSCEKLGLIFYNNYGMLGCFDKDKIEEYNDDSENKHGEHGINDTGQNSANEFNTVDSWADDPHFFHPVK